MPAENVATNRRYLSIRNGFMEERKGDSTTYHNRLANVHLVYADFKRVEVAGAYKGTSIRLYLVDTDDCFVLETWNNSSYATTFYKIMENIDLDKPFSISTKMVNKDGKNQHSLYINQGAESLKWYYTNSDPKGMPMVQKKEMPQLDGTIKTVYDSNLQQQFLLEQVNNWLIPALRRKPNPYPFHAVWSGIKEREDQETRPREERNIGYVESSTDSQNTDNGEIDDLPF